ncbi:MAG: cupin domain-containing protein [Bacteroidales bacterium]|nr:cupin domain-containing protein [Bacteroidales bacterium]
METAEYWIQHLNLLPHKEGGFYREVFRSSIGIEQYHLPIGYDGSRRIVTSIYYLLRTGDVSKFHRLRSDELWYYHHGSSIRIIIIDREGNKHTKFLGPRIEKAEHLQVLVPAGAIFGAEVIGNNTYGLCGCMVAPGFEFSDFEVFEKEDLIQAYPKHIDIINKFG